MTKQKLDKDSPQAAPPVVVFFQRRWKNVLYSIALFVLGLIAVLRFTAGKEAERSADFMHPPVSVRQLTEDDTAIANLEEAVSRRSELQAKYDGILAQAHLLQQNLIEAQSHAASLFERADIAATPYRAYSQGSLLIAEGRYAEALEGARQLREQLAREETPLLEAHNLLRIALLSQKLGEQEAEKEAWTTLLQGLETKPALQLFAQPFQAGQISLQDFVQRQLELEAS